MGAAPSVQAVGAIASGNNVATINVTMPACQDGDLLVVCWAARGGSRLTPAGWTRDVTRDDGTGFYFASVDIFTKPATSSDSGAVVAFGLASGTADQVAVALCLRTPRRNRPVAATASNGSGTSQVSSLNAGTASPVDGNLLAVTVWCCTPEFGGELSNIACPATERADFVAESVAGVGVAMAVSTDTSAPSATRTATVSVADGLMSSATIFVAGFGGQMAVI